MNTYICKVCGEQFSHTAQNQFASSPHVPPFWIRCTVCGRSQNWLGTAKQPDWWPSRLKTADRIDRQWRWTHWTLSLVIAFIVVYNVGSSIVKGISNSISKPSASEELSIPNMVGMNLQAAQDCLQELGFWNLDDQPADVSESKFQINDSNWTVRRQSKIGPASSKDVEIILYAENTGGEGGQSCP